MTIEQIVESWKNEKLAGIPSRFPCRAVMVNNIAEYCTLLEKLKTIPDIEMITASQLFSGDDVMPAFKNLTKPEYQNRWVILPGISEYLRLFSRSEAASQRFKNLWHSMRSASDKGRILIPLWGCRVQWYDKALHLNDDLRQNDFFVDLTSEAAQEQKLNVLVLSKDFGQYRENLSTAENQVFEHLSDWYQYWASPSAESREHVLITKQAKNIQSVSGNVAVRVINDLLSFDRAFLRNGEQLQADNCPPEAAALLFEPALKKMELKQAILTCLNVQQFKVTDVFSKWNSLSDGEKQLVLLWLRLDEKNDYLAYCVRRSTTPKELADHICYDVFAVRETNDAWEKQALELIHALNSPKDDRYFAELDKIVEYSARLNYLTGGTAKERIYLLHMVGEWMRYNADEVMQCEALHEMDPVLSAYLDQVPNLQDTDFERYFGLYKTYKLSNKLPPDEGAYFAGYEMERYPHRYSVMSDYTEGDFCVLWVDALGAEWLSLLYRSLRKIDGAAIKHAAVTRALLPTETEFNDQWNQMSAPHEKLDKLDKLAHKGVVDDPNYYACIAEQFDFVSTTVPQKVDELLKTYHRVIITGDHGTSRLAARFFHQREGFPTPEGAQVCSHGRYCVLSGPNAVKMESQISEQHSVNKNSYLVFKNYDHFKRSGFAAGGDDDNAQYGELHGGATPEEALVPVIVIDGSRELPVQANWKNASIKFMQKKAKPVVCFTKTVQFLQAKLGSADGECRPANADKTEWIITFKENRAEARPDHKYEVKLVADGKIIDLPLLEIKPALGGGDFDLL